MQPSNKRRVFTFINEFILEACHICTARCIISLHGNVNKLKLFFFFKFNVYKIRPPVRNEYKATKQENIILLLFCFRITKSCFAGRDENVEDSKRLKGQKEYVLSIAA